MHNEIFLTCKNHDVGQSEARNCGAGGTFCIIKFCLFLTYVAGLKAKHDGCQYNSRQRPLYKVLGSNF